MSGRWSIRRKRQILYWPLYPILNSPFSIPNSQFSIPNSQFKKMFDSKLFWKQTKQANRATGWSWVGSHRLHRERGGQSYHGELSALLARHGLLPIRGRQGRPPPGPGADGTRVPARILNGEVVHQWLNMEGNYARGMEFTVELGVSKSL